MGDWRLASEINKPLGFFALALLIVEAFLTSALFSSLSPENKFSCVLIGVILFLVLIAIVAILVWCKPTNLIYSEEAHLKHEKMFGTRENPRTEDEIAAQAFKMVSRKSGD